MSTEVAEQPLSVADARRARVDACDRLRMHKAAYERIRKARRLADISRARSECGLAILEFAGALAAEAEAEDRVDPVAAALRWRHAGMQAGLSHGGCDQAWRDYQEIRKTADQAGIDMGRSAWRVALVDWTWVLDARWAAEDAQHAEEVLGHLDDAGLVDPADAFPASPATRRQQIVRDSRERARKESLRKDRLRDGGGLTGWRPAGSNRPQS